MRTTVTIDDALLSEASKVTGVTERAELLREGLRALIARENARAIIALGGTDPDAWIPERSRSSSK